MDHKKWSYVELERRVGWDRQRFGGMRLEEFLHAPDREASDCLRVCIMTLDALDEESGRASTRMPSDYGEKLYRVHAEDLQTPSLEKSPWFEHGPDPKLACWMNLTEVIFLDLMERFRSLDVRDPVQVRHLKQYLILLSEKFRLASDRINILLGAIDDLVN